MRADEERDYVEYVQGRTLALRRSAFRLCGDWDHAYDLVQITFIKLYQHWRKAVAATSMDAYVSKILINAFLAEQRRWWQRRVRTSSSPVEVVEPSRDHDGTVDLMAALVRLAPGQRAVLVLRYWEGLDIEATAEVLGCSTGTVKGTIEGMTNR
jgi:RNA polymerase sigma factor (sigma-70 family)